MGAIYTNDPANNTPCGGQIRQIGGKTQMLCWCDGVAGVSIAASTYTELNAGDLVLIIAGATEAKSPRITNIASGVYETPGQLVGVIEDASLTIAKFPAGKWCWVTIAGDVDANLHVPATVTPAVLDYVRAQIHSTGDQLSGATDALSTTYNHDCLALEATPTTSTAATCGQLIAAPTDAATGTTETGHMEVWRVRLFGNRVDPAAA